MEFWGQFWASVLGALAGAIVGGGLAALTSWRLFTAGQAAIKTDRDDERRARSQERTRELVEKAFADLSVIADEHIDRRQG